MNYLIQEADLVVVLALLPVLIAEAGGAVVLQRVLQQAWLLAAHPAQLRLLPAKGKQGAWGHHWHYSWTDHHKEYKLCIHFTLKKKIAAFVKVDLVQRLVNSIKELATLIPSAPVHSREPNICHMRKVCCYVPFLYLIRSTVE